MYRGNKAGDKQRKQFVALHEGAVWSTHGSTKYVELRENTLLNIVPHLPENRENGFFIAHRFSRIRKADVHPSTSPRSTRRSMTAVGKSLKSPPG